MWNSRTFLLLATGVTLATAAAASPVAAAPAHARPAHCAAAGAACHVRHNRQPAAYRRRGGAMRPAEAAPPAATALAEPYVAERRPSDGRLTTPQLSGAVSGVPVSAALAPSPACASADGCPAMVEGIVVYGAPGAVADYQDRQRALLRRYAEAQQEARVQQAMDVIRPGIFQ